MNSFGAYADYYDCFYKDKDYSAEVTFVENVIQRHSPGARSILDLGCGTGRHAVEFARRGYSVAGVDKSPQMLELARARLQSLPAEVQQRLSIIDGDASQFSSPIKYDVVTALFHVACYQTSNRAITGLFESARGALSDRGAFIFDFWYGPAVLHDAPLPRNKRVNEASLEMTRLAEPVLHAERNVVDVSYTVLVVDEQTGRTKEIRELHALRYFFLPELELLANGAGLELLETGQWLNGNSLNMNSWLGYGSARVRR